LRDSTVDVILNKLDRCDLEKSVRVFSGDI